MCFMDIGGDRRCQPPACKTNKHGRGLAVRQVLGALRLIQEHLPGMRLIAVKSEELYDSMKQWTGEKGLGDGPSAAIGLWKLF